MNKLVILFILLSYTLAGGATEDSVVVSSADKQPFFKRIIGGMYEFVKDFSRVDTSYIEPQAYNFTAMLQTTYTYEKYTLQTPEGQSITLAPQPTIKMGPYWGWRWVFLGYQFDLRHLRGKNKKEFDLSLYSSQIGIDLFFRKTGTNYKIQSFVGKQGSRINELYNTPFDGIQSSVKGFNLYYIFNHRKFSYPAAFSQSTIQRRSAGSALAGIGYTKHTLDIDWQKLDRVIEEKNIDKSKIGVLDTTLLASKIHYTDIALSGGYAYNWAFAHNWLLAGSLSLAVGYKRTLGDVSAEKQTFRDFFLNSFNIDGVGRFGLVWNNMRWYAGSSIILHTYNFRRNKFSTNNMFGSLNIYVGFNFGKR